MSRFVREIAYKESKKFKELKEASIREDNFEKAKKLRNLKEESLKKWKFLKTLNATMEKKN